MRFTLKVWRQNGPKDAGGFATYPVENLSADMSFLEMLDVLNEQLTRKGEAPVAFDHDCREGICGSCGFVINGEAHGPRSASTVCQLYLRDLRDGETLTCEPWRAMAFPVLKDLCVDRGAFDRIIQAGGFISTPTGAAVDGNAIPIAKAVSDKSMDAAQCIGCGACVAACPNASAMLFTAAKVAHLGLMPQGQPERRRRAREMVARMDAEGFGGCTNHGECQAACPKEIPVEFIARMNREYLRATVVPDV